MKPAPVAAITKVREADSAPDAPVLRTATINCSVRDLLFAANSSLIPITPCSGESALSSAAFFVGGNPATADTATRWWLEALQTSPEADLISLSGWLGDSPEQSAPGHWLPAGRAKLQQIASEFCEVGATLGRRSLLPHAAHLLSDASAALRLVLRQHESARIDSAVGSDESPSAASPSRQLSLAMCPALLLTSSMLSHANEHLERILSITGPHCAFIFACDARIAIANESNSPISRLRAPPTARSRSVYMQQVAEELLDDVTLTPCAPGKGCIDGRYLGSLIRTFAADCSTLVLARDERASTLEWLGLSDC